VTKAMAAAAEKSPLTTLQRVVLPSEADPEVFALYLDADNWGEIAGRSVRLSDESHVDDVLGRQKLRIRPGKHVSFASYFNAFPAGYWQRWTSITSVLLTVRTSGPGNVLLYRSNARGIPQRIDSRVVTGKNQSITFDLPLTNFIDGGWYWFDLIAGTEELVFEGGEFATAHQPNRTGKASIAITTFNRPDYCLEVIKTLTSEVELDDVIDAVFVIDQGTQKVSDQAGYAAVAKKFGKRLHHINQPNLGGSGGFSRGMIETLERKDSGFVLLLDDDVVVESEGIIRAVTFGRYTHEPTIVGGHMFDMFDRAQLHTFSERVERNKFMWGAKVDGQFRHNFHKSNLRQTAWLHERADVDFNGWWMSLIPVDIIREIGLSLPIFIKWDDAEYSLRASDHGFSTVSFPGAAVWHVSWQDKDDFKDWQTYFHGRNRWIAALLHSPRKKGGYFVWDSLQLSVKHLLKMQYYTAELYEMALDDVMRGPQVLHPEMASKLGEVRAKSSGFTETIILRDSAAFPEPLINLGAVGEYKRMSRFQLALWLSGKLPRHFINAPKRNVGARPEVSLTASQATWDQLAGYDSALVSTADGSGMSHYRRNAKEFRRRFQHTIRMHRKLRRSWRRLSTEYRSNLAAITSVEAWKKTLGL
jgi:galactofuranosylgalactofuranosylrhamnosyl-N-acetylglucosaminyl-diphospho-decaprenol beta-1,5/1,6-galactofuranosyltransferase